MAQATIQRQHAPLPAPTQAKGPLLLTYSVVCEHCGIESSRYYVHRQYVQGLLDRDGWEYVAWQGWYCHEHAALGKEMASISRKQASTSTGERRCVGCGESLEGMHPQRIRCKSCADDAKKKYGTQYSSLKRHGKIVPRPVRYKQEARAQ